MSHVPSDIAFTSAVKAIQHQKGSRKNYARMEQSGGWQTTVTSDLTEFLTDLDMFYLGTANAEGQPYSQYRGGPPGYLKVIDDRTPAFADFGGNLFGVDQFSPSRCLNRKCYRNGGLKIVRFFAPTHSRQQFNTTNPSGGSGSGGNRPGGQHRRGAGGSPRSSRSVWHSSRPIQAVELGPVSVPVTPLGPCR